ncbi:MAG: alkaline phosphatase family protein [Planctomycetes bacterium]|nr:alkaline phosphatase family protein [Planctomycetota bacterium]
MPNNVVFLSIPGLRDQDLDQTPRLAALATRGTKSRLVPSFPCVTWPVQANMLTGKLPSEHGVIANGFYWRDEQKVEMWTAGNKVISAPQIWDRLHELDNELTSAVWFPMLSKRCGADFVCMPAPVHNPDGSESLWCYTKPTELYGDLLDELGHFPLQHFWGPLANIKSTTWIADSAIVAARQFQPRFFYLYLPHLDYAGQKTGQAALGDDNIVWMAASEYVITPVDHVTYPNRLLRDAGLLQVRLEDDGEHLDLETSDAWAMVDHQFSHVFVKDADATVIQRVANLFRGTNGISEVLIGDQQAKYSMDHERSGDVLLISTTNSWQAYYWWMHDDNAPAFARTVDIHQKPGYDPVEMHIDMKTKSTPLDATLVKGSHGAPVESESQQGVLLCSKPGVVSADVVRDVEIADLVMNEFGA